MTPSHSLLNNFKDELTLLQSDGFMAVLLHQDGITMAANDKMSETTGYSLEEMLGMNAWALHSPDSLAKVQQEMFKNTNTEYETVGITKTNQHYKAKLKIFHLTYQGEVCRLVGLKVL